MSSQAIGWLISLGAVALACGCEGSSSRADGAGNTAGDDGDISGGSLGTSACVTSMQQADHIPANLLFVIDKSKGMNCNAPEGDSALNSLCSVDPTQQDPDAPSKWEITTAALIAAIDSLAEQSHVSVGVQLFPGGECVVEQEPEIAVSKLDAAVHSEIADLLQATTPDGSSASVGTTILSYRYLSERVRAGSLVGISFVVLLAAGSEACDPGHIPNFVERDVPLATRFAIRTFAIGLAGSESARAMLSQAAYNGGTAASESCDHSASSEAVGDCHFDLTTSTDLAAGLQQALLDISHNRWLSCEFDVPRNADGDPVDPNEVNVTFTPGGGEAEEISKDDTDCTSAEGWQYDANASKVVLCGEVCERLRTDPGARVDFQLGCPTRTAN